jgi:hypothetical protein
MTPDLHRYRSVALLLLSALLTASCATVPRTTGALRGIDGQACVVGTTVVPAQVEEVSDPAVLASALGRGGEGRICAGRVFRVQAPLPVYRVWDGAKANTYGEWWALEPPRGDREDYRRAYAVCPEWNALDHLAACMLKPGATIVLGPGQSATCADRTYEKSPMTQLFIKGRQDDIRAQMDACTSTPWP